ELSNGYWDLLDRLPAYRALLPRSGLERSDFVPWPIGEVDALPIDVCSVRRAALICSGGLS
ncbi:hypothetical protein ABIB68_001545, partial [Bradyrhizobium sp. F1.2.2]|uniref:hypothetical protein n=1 Tax=unclassified Bradyrhizobium TaxID=2631580 RepID=UPI003399DBF3